MTAVKNTDKSKEKEESVSKAENTTAQKPKAVKAEQTTKNTPKTDSANKSNAKSKSNSSKGASKNGNAKKSSVDERKKSAQKESSDIQSEIDKIRVELLPEDDDEIITLFDDDEKGFDFFQIACIEYKKDFYVVLQPVEPMEDLKEDEAVILKMEAGNEDDEDDIFTPVNDEKLIDLLFEGFIKAVADAEAYLDEEESE